MPSGTPTPPEAVRTAWINRYTSPDGRIVSDTQTAYSLAIVFNIVRDPQTVERMGERLAALSRRDGYRIGTGSSARPTSRMR